MTEQTKLTDCGCEVPFWRPEAGNIVINFCPLHEAAEATAKQAQIIVDEVLANNGQVATWQILRLRGALMGLSIDDKQIEETCCYLGDRSCYNKARYGIYPRNKLYFETYSCFWHLVELSNTDDRIVDLQVENKEPANGL